MGAFCVNQVEFTEIEYALLVYRIYPQHRPCMLNLLNVKSETFNQGY